MIFELRTRMDRESLQGVLFSLPWKSNIIPKEIEAWNSAVRLKDILKNASMKLHRKFYTSESSSLTSRHESFWYLQIWTALCLTTAWSTNYTLECTKEVTLAKNSFFPLSEAIKLSWQIANLNASSALSNWRAGFWV